MRLVLGSIGVLLLGLVITAPDGRGADLKLVKLDLSKAGEVNDGKTKAPWRLTIQAPAGAKTQLVFGGIWVRDDLDTFDLAIELAKTKTIADEKKEWTKDKATKKIIVDKEDTLVREFEFGMATKRLAYQFVKFKTVGDKIYVMNGGGRSGASKASVDLMLKCADTLTPSK
jgi:hypothetical protein